MIFSNYLNPQAREVIQIIRKANYNVVENISWCTNGYAGGIIRESRTFFICTHNILDGPSARQSLHETIYHEAAHAAQMCRGLRPIGIPLNAMPLPWEKRVNIKKSLSLTKNRVSSIIEHEAYWLEDKPIEVVKYLRKFCF